MSWVFFFQQSVISQKIFHEAFREWRKCKYEVEQLEKKDAMSCPACRNDLHACHIDGNRISCIVLKIWQCEYKNNLHLHV